MVFGCGFYALFLVFLFYPPSNVTPVINSIWFGVFYVFFYIADTTCGIPYQALAPELSADTNQRAKLFIVIYSFQYVGILFCSISPVLIQKILKVKQYK